MLLRAFLASLAAFGGYVFHLLAALPGSHTFGLVLVGSLTVWLVGYLICDVTDGPTVRRVLRRHGEGLALVTGLAGLLSFCAALTVFWTFRQQQQGYTVVDGLFTDGDPVGMVSPTAYAASLVVMVVVAVTWVVWSVTAEVRMNRR
jgi:uncharacterized membrane protein (DUF106 family)